MNAKRTQEIYQKLGETFEKLLNDDVTVVQANTLLREHKVEIKRQEEYIKVLRKFKKTLKYAGQEELYSEKLKKITSDLLNFETKMNEGTATWSELEDIDGRLSEIVNWDAKQKFPEKS
jgi:hypothetical protein